MVRSRNSISRANQLFYAYYDDEEESFLLFLKTYGASKYESFFPLSHRSADESLVSSCLEEGELNELPEWVNNYGNMKDDWYARLLEWKWTITGPMGCPPSSFSSPPC